MGKSTNFLWPFSSSQTVSHYQRVGVFFTFSQPFPGPGNHKMSVGPSVARGRAALGRGAAEDFEAQGSLQAGWIVWGNFHWNMEISMGILWDFMEFYGDLSSILLGD